MSETTKVGKRGTFVIPARLRRKYGMTEGSDIIAEETEDGILLRPAVTLPIEIYSAARRAEFLLNNAVDDKDYEGALEEVKRLGIDPKTIEHSRS